LTMADAIIPATARIIITFDSAIWWRYLNRDVGFVPPHSKQTDGQKPLQNNALLKNSMPSSVHCTAVTAFKGSINLKNLGSWN
jgi:hypothetical protein